MTRFMPPWLRISFSLLMMMGLIFLTISILQAKVSQQSPVILFEDTFNRANNSAVGNGWVEVEASGAQVSLDNNRLCFVDTSDVVNRPLVRHSFQQVNTGQLTWVFDFDWSRSGSEKDYRLFMQLGQGNLMSDNDQGAGVGVNLVWTQLGGTHQMLGYRQGGSVTGLSQMSGSSQITVQANLATHTFDVLVGGVVIQSGIGFNQSVALDTVRFFTDGLNEQNFAGRCFDNLLIQTPGSVGEAPAITSGAVIDAIAGQAYSYDVEATGNPAPTYSLTSAPDGMAIDATTGLISWTPGSSGSFDVTVQASNSAGSDTQSFTITVTQIPSIVSAAVTNATVNQAYSYDVEATGSPAPTYSLTSAPNGMGIDPTTGLISWTPSSSGNFNVTVQASNAAGNDTQSFSIAVAQSPTIPSITSNAVITGTVGQTYSYDVEATGNPVPTYSLNSAPSGMTIEPTTGVISWTPTISGSFNVTVQAGNSAGDDFQTYTITVIDAATGKDMGNVGSYPKWSKVEIALTGPASVGMSTAANPFQIIMDVTFTGPGEETFVVPAFYDGDGTGGLDGDVWKVRFSPNIEGTWTFTSTSANAMLDGYTGSFDVTTPTSCQAYTPGDLPDFSCVGRLEYVGERYLKFADGPYWLKGGADEPEDFLALGQTVGFASKEAALDYLADKGVNSLYIMMHNVDGDGQNVWPWVGATAGAAQTNDEHFDVNKLAEWESIFTYAQNKGLVLHLVFEDDLGWTGFNRSMYYREMVARFGHHNGLYWNISEEYNENYSSAEVQTFAQMLKDLDTYNHPLTVHQEGPLSNWNPFIGNNLFDLTSFQTELSPQNATAISWLQTIEASGRTIPISFDETGQLDSTQRNLARHIVWSVYLAGANYEMLTILSSSGYTDYALFFEDMSRARAFVEDLPFWEMRPMNGLLLSGQGYVFAKADEVYTTYLPAGGSMSLDLSATANSFDASWFDPQNGSTQAIGLIQGGGTVVFTAPNSNDWMLLLQKATSTSTPPQITSTPITIATTGQTYSYDVEATGSPAPTYSLTTAPAGMSIDTSTGLISWMPSAGGNFNVTVQASNSAGSDTQSFTVVVTTPPTSTLLLEDTFNRANNNAVGNGWVEVEATGAQLSIDTNRLCFVDTSDVSNRPLVRHSFQQANSGQLIWTFDFDWARSGSEGDYRLFMQLGQGNLMSDNDQATGVGVNLVWTQLGEIHEMLGYRQAGNMTGLAQMSGSSPVTVQANLATHTFDVLIGGVLVQSGIGFDQSVALDTVRFFTDGLNEQNFAGRCFDNLQIEGSEIESTAPIIISTPLTETIVGRPYNYNVTVTGYPAPTYALTTAPAGMTIDTTNGLINWTPTITGDFAVIVEVNNSVGSATQTFTLSVAEDLTFTCATPIRIMPLGDSITIGNASGVDDDNKKISYRKDLWDSLIAAGYNVDFVGSPVNGQFYAGFDADHEGHGGWRDDEIAFNIYNNGGANWLNNTPADVILLHIGTNALNTDPGDVEDILNEIDEYEVANNTTVVVILTRIINQLNHSSSLTTQFNNNVVAMAQTRIVNGDNIIIVDMEDGAGINYAAYPTGDMWDGLHPYATGYTKMAVVWYNALDDFLPVCSSTSSPPIITSSPETEAILGQLYSYNVDASGNPAPTYALTTAPAGMSIDATSGAISWTANITGSVAITVETTNSAGTDTQNFTINVVDNSPSITSNAVTNATVGQAYSYDVQATGNPAPTYSLTIAPGGMSIDAITGLINWTPTTAGSFPVTVQASNSAGTHSQSFTIEVNQAPSCPAGMVSYWKLDETSGTSFADFYGSNNATFVGAGSPGFAAGQVNGALDFDGTFQALSTASTANPTSQLTVAAWINPDNLSDPDRGIISKQNAFVFEIESNGSELAFTAINGGSISEFEPDVPANEISTGTWTHVAATFDAGQMTIYVNGSQVASTTSTITALGSSSEAYYLGWTSHTAFGTDRYFDGKLDEVAVFNQALSATQIQQLYVTSLAGQGYCGNVVPTITSNAVTVGTVGQSYSYDVEATGNPAATYSLTAAPADMSIDANTGLIAWTPSGSGSFNVTVQATNSAGNDTQSFTIVVSEAPAIPSITSSAVTAATVGQAYSYDVEATGNPAPTFSLTAAPAGMSIDANTGLIAWTPSAGGSFNVTVQATNSTGNDTQSFAVVVTAPPTSTLLLEDTFNRANNSAVGNGWVEVEATGAQLAIDTNRLCFVDTSDVVNRPLVRHSFQQVNTGQLTWVFDFDWSRSGSEGDYRLFMQLGQGNLMNDNDQGAGVGVNLVWTQLGGTHGMLGYRQAGTVTGLSQMSGSSQVTVQANLVTHTFDVLVGGVVVQSGIGFDQSVALDTVRFFTDGLNEQNFAGRCFDNILIERN